MKFNNIRELILEILMKVEKQNAYLNILMQYYFDYYPLKKEDKALVQEITYGVTRFRKKLDWIIKQSLTKQGKKLPLDINNILRIGIYQIFYLDKIPDYAIVNESVNLAKKSKYFQYSNLVNAILRKIIRKPNDIYWPNINKNPVKYISEYFSFPEWLINMWIKRYGLNLCINICQIMNKKPPTILRINPLRTNMPELQKKLSNLMVSFKEGQYLPFESLILEEFVDITVFEIFKSGFFSIQDESSSLVSRLLDPLPGELIIDMCSGPGGKTTHLAQLMKNQGEIIAFEKNKKRLNMVKSEARRLGISNIKYLLQDSTIFCANFFEKADKVLVDAPCSGTGVIRKKPDIKWKNLNDRQLQIFNNLQMEILNVASKYLRPGGKLVYSTCSIEREENDCIINKFLKNNTGFTIQETSSFVKKYGVVKYNTGIKQAIQLLPGYSGENIDGFYMAKIMKKMTG